MDLQTERGKERAREKERPFFTKARWDLFSVIDTHTLICFVFQFITEIKNYIKTKTSSLYLYSH